MLIGKLCRIACSCLLMVLTILTSAPAAIYYVDATGGSDVHDGLSLERAWKTIRKVKNKSFNPGDEIRFKRGEVFDDDILYVYSSGAEGKPIVFRDYGDPSDLPPLITYHVNFCIWMRDRSFLTFQNLRVAGGAEAVIELKQSAIGETHHIVIKDCIISGAKIGVMVDTAKGGLIEGCEIYNCDIGFSTHDPGFTVRNCKIHDNKCGISVGTYDTIIEGNEIYRNQVGIKYGWGYGNHNVIFRYNLIQDNTSHGFEAYYNFVKAGDIYYNIFSNNGGDGLLLKSGVSGINIFNNVICSNGGNGINLVKERDSAPSAIVLKNNIIVDNWRYEISIAKGVTGLVSDYNCVYHPVAEIFMHWGGTDYSWKDWKSHSGQDGHSINQNPFFIKKAGRDFKLQANSPCIDAGVDVGLKGADYYGNPVPWRKFDMGVHEVQEPKK